MEVVLFVEFGLHSKCRFFRSILFQIIGMKYILMAFIIWSCIKNFGDWLEENIDAGGILVFHTVGQQIE